MTQIRTKNKRNVLHTPVCETLLPVDTVLFKALAGGLEVVDRDADVTETLGLIVSVVIDLTFFLLGTVVPAEI